MERDIDKNFLRTLGIEEQNHGVSTGKIWNKSAAGDNLAVLSPVDGKTIASVYQADAEAYHKVVEKALDAFEFWRQIPAPERGEVVRLIGLKIRDFKQPLGSLDLKQAGLF